MKLEEFNSKEEIIEEIIAMFSDEENEEQMGDLLEELSKDYSIDKDNFETIYELMILAYKNGERITKQSLN